MGLGWVWGRVLHVDLSSGRSWAEGLPETVYRLLLGGRGLASYLVYRNLLVSLLCTELPCSSR